MTEENSGEEVLSGDIKQRFHNPNLKKNVRIESRTIHDI
jgi:hypothetical protein